MKSDDLRKAIGEIDDYLIENSENKGKDVRTGISWARWGAAAAVLVCVITAAVIVPGMLTESAPVTAPGTDRSEDITGKDPEKPKEESSITDIRNSDGTTEKNEGMETGNTQVPETEPAGETADNSDVTETDPKEYQPGQDNNPGGKAGYTAGAVYTKVPLSYEDARERFGHPMAICEDAGFLGYRAGIISRSGDTGSEESICLDVEYGFVRGRITVRDESRTSSKFSTFNPVEYEYLGRIFLEDGDSAHGESRMLVYYPQGEDGDIVYIAEFDMSYDIYEIMHLIISLEF